MKSVALAFAVALVAPVTADGQSLGRFFFTPAERVELDAARARKRQAPAPAPVVEPAPTPPPRRTVTYGGIVRRSDGRSMLWLNDRLADEQEALASLDLRGRVGADGSVSLGVSEDDAEIRVKVGQSAEIHTRTVMERSRLPARRGNLKRSSLDGHETAPDVRNEPAAPSP
jgi:hypothetical protein